MLTLDPSRETHGGAYRGAHYVTGNATLGGATVNAIFAPGTFVGSKHFAA